jgi:hypothetical protein
LRVTEVSDGASTSGSKATRRLACPVREGSLRRPAKRVSRLVAHDRASARASMQGRPRSPSR